MKIHGIFLPLLITGILGFSDIHVYISHVLNSAVYEIFETFYMKNEYEDVTIDAYANGIWNRARKTCETNGGPGALMIAYGKILNIMQCIASQKESNLVDWLDFARSGLTSYCSHITGLESCLEEFKRNNPCLGPAELESFDVYRDVIIAMLKSTCKPNYDLLESGDGTECVGRALKRMEIHKGQEFRKTLRQHVSEVISTSEIPWRVPDKDDCAKWEKILEYDHRALQQCGNPEVTNLNKDKDNEILVALRCRKSAISQSSLVSLIILLIVTALMALNFSFN